MNFHRNDLIDKVLVRNFESFEITVDTADYVPQRYLRKIHRLLFRNLKRQFRFAKKEDRLYQRTLRRDKHQSYSRQNAGTRRQATRRKNMTAEQDKQDRIPTET